MGIAITAIISYIAKEGIKVDITADLKCINEMSVIDIYSKIYLGERINIIHHENLIIENKIIMDKNNQPIKCIKNED